MQRSHLKPPAGWVFAAVLALASHAYAAAPIDHARSLEAARMAMGALEERLQKEPDDWEFATYVKDIRNYDIGISENKQVYVVVFVLRDIPGQGPFNGGRADFYLDKRTLKVVRFVGHK